MDNTEDILKNYRGRYSSYWIERWGLIPELPTSFDNANSIYELTAWLQRAFKNLLDDFQHLESEFEDFKSALIDLLEYLIPELIRRYSNSAEFRALFIELLEDILAGEERNWVKDLLKELLEVDMREWIENYLKELYGLELKAFFKEVENARGNADTLYERLAEVDYELAQARNDISTHGNRIDSIIAHAGDGSVPTELTDIRVGANNITYTTAGVAVRSQLSNLSDRLDVTDKLLGRAVYTIVDKSFVNNDGEFVSDSNWARTNYIDCQGSLVVEITNTGKDTAYNAEFDANKKFVKSFSVFTGTKRYQLDNLTRFIALSNEASELTKMTVKIKDSIKEETAKQLAVISHTNYAISSQYETGYNMLNPQGILLGLYLDPQNGKENPIEGWFVSSPMAVKQGEQYRLIILGEDYTWKKVSGAVYCIYDRNGVFLRGETSEDGITAQKGEAYVRVSTYSSIVNNLIFSTFDKTEAFIGTSKEKLPFETAPKNSYSVLSVNTEKPYTQKMMAGNVRLGEKTFPFGVFIKFEKITIRTQAKLIVKTWSELVNDLSTNTNVSFMNSYELVKDCLRLRLKFMLVFDLLDEKFKAKYETNDLTQSDLVLLYVTENGDLSGWLVSEYQQKKVIGIENYRRQLDAKKIEALDNMAEFNFSYSTDAHTYFDEDGYKNYTTDVVNEFDKTLNLDAVVNGGDSIAYGTMSKPLGLSALIKTLDVDRTKLLYAIGNHDYNGVSFSENEAKKNNRQWTFSRKDVERLLLKDLTDIVRPANKHYYYKDFASAKIRFIVLDTSDVEEQYDSAGNIVTDPLVTYIVGKEQIDWLRQTALHVEEGWDIVITMHVGIYMWEDGFTSNSYLHNCNAIREIFRAFNAKSAYSYNLEYENSLTTGDFEGSNGTIACVLSGHAHADGYCNKHGFNAIQTACSYPDIAQKPERSVGDPSEVAVDIVSVDKSTRKVTLTRFGYGRNRSYNY